MTRQKHKRVATVAGCGSAPAAVRRRLLAVAVAGLFAWPNGAMAAMGRIQVLSAPGEAFNAWIPLVDDRPDGVVNVHLADRNQYPMLAPFSQSASQLQFTLQRELNGTPSGIQVSGPAQFAEAELDFAVAMQWPSGGEVREFQVDYRHRELVRSSRDTPPSDDKKPHAAHQTLTGLDNVALGTLKVVSAPGTPLFAEAPLLGLTAADAPQLRVRVSPAQAGTPGPEILSLLASMQYAVVAGPGQSQLLQLHSQQPFSLSQLDFRLDVSLGRVHLARRYQLSAQADQIRVIEHRLASADAAFRVLRVLPGDTLSSVAQRLRHAGISPRQAMQRLYQENPRAFIDGDMNRLLAGALLRYPQQWADADTPTPERAGQAPSPSGADSARLQALRHTLQQQASQLSAAHAASQALERKLADLQQRQSAKASQAPAKSVPRQPISPVLLAAGGGAILLAAAGTALALRRRRLRAASPDGAAQGVPTVEGMRQWLRYDPTRDDLRYRLLLLLASQNDRAGFIEQAELARERFAPHGEMWQGVLQMGRELAPDYPWTAAEAAVAQEISPALSAVPLTVSSAPLTTPLSEPDPLAALLPASADAMPERPLLELGGLDELAPDLVVFRDAAATSDTEPDIPSPLDHRALAQLFMEMGDRQSADDLLRTPGA